MWLDYPVPGGTFRENMWCEPGKKRLPDDHPAGKIRLERLAKTKAKLEALAAKENGHVNGVTPNGTGVQVPPTESVSEVQIAA